MSDPGPATNKKSSMTTLWEITVKYVVGQKELTEHEGTQVVQCWHDTEPIQDSTEKMAKFKKLLGMKFGPKGNSVYELMMKRREQTIQMIQQKQQQKRQQQEMAGASSNTVDLTGGANGGQVPTQQPTLQNSAHFQPGQGSGAAQAHMPTHQAPAPQQLHQQHQQQPQAAFNYTHPPQLGGVLPQQQQQFMPQGQPFVPMMNINGQQQQQQPQPNATFNTFSTLPPGASGYAGQVMNNGPLLAPSTMGSGSGNASGGMGSGMGNMAGTGGYPAGSNMNSTMGMNTNPANLNLNMQKPANVIFNNPGMMNPLSNQLNMNNTMNMSTMNNNNMSNLANNAATNAALNAANAKKAPAKRTAGKAGLDETGDTKKPPAKKRNPPAKPSVPGQTGMGMGMMQGQMGQMQGQMGQMQGQGPGGFGGMQQHQQGMAQLPPGLNTNPNRPLNHPGGPGYYTGSGSGANLSGMQSSAPHQPPTVAQEIEGMTERMNSAQEGIEPAGDNALTAPLALPQDFLRNEADLAREKLRLNLSSAVGLNLPGPINTAGANRFQPGAGAFGAGSAGGPGPTMAQHEASQPWQYHNIVDKSIMARAAVHVLEGRDLKIGVPSLNTLSMGIQQHLKNVLEAAFKTSKSRINRTALNSYEGISRMIVEHGKGNALPENQQNIAIKWSEDVRTILLTEEQNARKSLKQYDTALEESLQEKMKAFDEERGKTGNKRKLGDADIPWWTKEDGAEKAGLLGWSDLAMVSYKNSVARKHELGAHAHSSKKGGRNSLPGRSHVVAPAKPDEAGAIGAPAGASSASAAAGVLTGGAGVSSNSADATGSTSASVDWSRQPCPLTLPRTNQVMLLEEDLAGTLARSTGSRALPSSGVLSSTRTTGTCLYKWKMGVYTGAAANP